MECSAGIGIYINKAQFMSESILFKNKDKTKERVVQCYELALFLKDGGYSVINGKKYAITAGSIRFHKPNDKVYSYRFNDIYVVHFSVDDVSKSEKIFSKIPSFIKLSEFTNEIVVFKNLIASLLEQDDFECISCLWYLLRRIKEEYSLQQRANNEKTVFQIKKYIYNNFSKQLTLAHIAEKFYMHPIYLQKKFKKEIGITPSQYQKEVRISKAKAYLLSTDFSVDEISEKCGFCNTSYFIKIFKIETAFTPLQFRQKFNIFNMF